ncbi:phosphotransferase [Paenibacillus sp. JJ-223]|uniref:phosphotransferase enzyme family protein n=1 Tax=Paenibacillus sp. JJ-223 TaxID=2905647 RepID=UPI001F1B2E00|nr:phosphotransferase [Paenibacillus sp. JJ-223]CAH1205870.1 Homoserine kinase [Paenibacillus sp. JJ-223]
MPRTFQISSEENVRKILANSKHAALRALQSYDLDWDHIRFNQLSDTCTFVVQTSKSQTLLLRIHPGMNKEELRSELVWLDVLNRLTNIPVPQGVPNRHGDSVLELKGDHGDDLPVYATLMRWVDGINEGRELSEEQVFNEGVLLAKLHHASRQFEPPADFTRPEWGLPSFNASMERLAEHHKAFLSHDGFALYQSAAEKVRTHLAGLVKDTTNYGLIHGDLHQGNIVFDGKHPRPIDFGRCGFGYFLYDVAHTILGLYPAQRKLVLEGYQSIRKPAADGLQELESFAVMAMLENFAHHAPDPRETDSLKEEQSYAQAILRHYLSGSPFLFQAIEL